MRCVGLASHLIQQRGADKGFPIGGCEMTRPEAKSSDSSLPRMQSLEEAISNLGEEFCHKVRQAAKKKLENRPVSEPMTIRLEIDLHVAFE